MTMPVVAIVGHPNAGKSTLFNRITRTRDALVDDLPGVTRDRHYGAARWNDREFILVDTGGFSFANEDELGALTREQIHAAVQEADAVILLLDGKVGVTPYDDELIKLVRHLTRPVFYTVNKIDGPEREHHHYDFYRLGVAPLYTLSAEHGYGVPDFLDALTASLPAADATPSEDAVRISVIGRPNVGKSSLINRILGENRVMVSPHPGTTRDAVDTPCRVHDRACLLIDTAGIRRKKQVSAKIEKFSIIKALKSIDRSDVALIMLDAAEGITEQDVRIAGYAFERGRACIFLLNKWDLVEKAGNPLRRLKDDLLDAGKYISFAPVLPISALTGKGVSKIFPVLGEVYDQFNTRISTGPLNKIFEQATLRTEPSLFRGRRIKFFYATQIAVKPPTFVSFVNYPEGVHFSYQRYLINQVRAQTGLDKVPLRLFFRKRSGAEAPRRRPRSAGNKTKRSKK